MTGSLDVTEFRKHFASLDHLVYLNSGSYGLLADRVAQGFHSYLEGRVRVGADWNGWVGQLEQVRSAVARLLGADPDEVAITASATAGLNALASSLDLQGARNTLLVTNSDFPTGAQIWHAQERTGARVLHVPEEADHTVSVEKVANLLDGNVALVALSHLCYRHGGRLSDDAIREISRLAHEKGALVLLDSYQIVGTAPISPHALGVDFMVGGMLKYLLGTAGIGFMFVRKGLSESLQPRSSGWFTQADIGAMDIFANAPSRSARRFEAGTPPVPSLAPALAGIELILEAGLERIEAQIQRVTRYTMDRLDDHGIAFDNPADDRLRGPLISVPSRDEQGLVDALAKCNIVTSSRDGRLRAGFHAYNIEQDADAFAAALDANRGLLA